jgi:hypothetical protein
MSAAANLVDSFVKSEQAKEKAVTLDVGRGRFIVVRPEVAQECVEQGVGTIVEPRKSLFGFEPR